MHNITKRSVGGPSLDRRSFLLGGLLAAGAVALEPMFGGTGRVGAATARPLSSPYLAGNYAPVHREVSATGLRVTGRLPEGLSGHFIRNGPNPITAPNGPYSWFGGDGMLHIVELDEGKARSYRSRWVRTPAVAEHLGEGPPSGPASRTGVDLSNTNTAKLGGRLLSVTESALPYEITVGGTTVGRTDLGGTLTHGLSAHAKYDPVTREVHQIGYRPLSPPYAVWQVFDESGAVTRSQPIDLPAAVMIHQTSLTPSYVLVYDLPVTISAASLQAGWSVPYAWDPTHQARLGVITRATGAIRWIDLPPVFSFHDASAYDTREGLAVTLVTYPRVFDTDRGGPLPDTSRLEEWSIDLSRGSVTRRVLDARPQEFPRVSDAAFGRAHRYLYSVAAPHRRGSLGTVLGLGNQLVRHDLHTQRSVTWFPGAHRSVGEAVFVDDPSRTGEDGGWLLAYVYDAPSGRSAFVVLDAADLRSGPVATVALPQRVPAGFHGNWYPAV